MTLTDTLDHLLSVFLRPLRTWIEREFIAPWKAAYDAAMQTKEQYRDGVYLHALRMGATRPDTLNLANLPQAVRSIVDNNYQAKQDGYAHDPKATYYVLSNENTYTKDKPFLLMFYGRLYDTIALSGADAYLTSDGDYYTADTTHTWAKDYKSNRWVAYIFDESESVDFVISDHALSPEKIYVRGKFDKIRTTYTYVKYSFEVGRINEIVVPDGNELGTFSSSIGETWSQALTLRNIKRIGRLFGSGTYNITSMYFDGDDIIADLTGNSGNSTTLNFTSCIMPNIKTLNYFWRNTNATLKNWWMPSLEVVNTPLDHANSSGTGLTRLELPNVVRCTQQIGFYVYDGSLQYLYAPKMEESSTPLFEGYDGPSYFHGTALRYIYLGYYTNDRTHGIVLDTRTNPNYPNLTDIELKDGYRKPLNIAAASALTEENIRTHIIDRLADNRFEDDGETPAPTITITLGSTNLAKLTAEDIAIANYKNYTLA